MLSVVRNLKLLGGCGRRRVARLQPRTHCYPQMGRRFVVEKRNDPRYDFDANPTLDELIAQQGKIPIGDVRVLRGEFWPDDEPIEGFLAALHDWRGHKKAGPAA